MLHYRNFLPEELAADPSFRRWVLFNNPADGALWTEWLEDNPDKQDLVNHARNFLVSTEAAFDRISDEEVAN